MRDKENNQSLPHVYVVIPAGGLSTRFSLGNKLLQRLQNGLTVLETTLNIFLSHERVKKIIVPVSDLVDQSFFKPHPKIEFVKGGASRMASVKNGVMAISDTQEAIVLVHDGARPCLDEKLISYLIDSCIENRQAVIPVIPVRETVKIVSNDNYVKETISRDALRLVQTPQAFPLQALKSLYNQINDDEVSSLVTDEAMLFEKFNQPVLTVAGDTENIKITYECDLKWANFYLAEKSGQL